MRADALRMAMRTVPGGRTGEDVDDLADFLRGLSSGPEVHEVVALTCAEHGDEQPGWAYVEADARTGLARRRCLACACAVPLLDSEQRWTHPPMFCCPGCRTSIVELAAGLSVPDGEHVAWVVLAARCVECGRLSGLTDVVVADRPVAEVLSRL